MKNRDRRRGIREPIPIVFAAADKLVGCDIFLPPSSVCELCNIVPCYVLPVVIHSSSLTADTEDKAVKCDLANIVPNTNTSPKYLFVMHRCKNVQRYDHSFQVALSYHDQRWSSARDPSVWLDPQHGMNCCWSWDICQTFRHLSIH